LSNPEAPKDRDWLGDTFEQADSLTNDLPRWAQPVVTASSASNISIEPSGWEDYCHLCLGPNIDWSAPSPLWNQVMRGGSINGDEIHDGVVCPTCFATLAEQAGVATFWRLSATNVRVELETVTPSGRVWDDRIWMWVEPDELVCGINPKEMAKEILAQFGANEVSELGTVVIPDWLWSVSDLYPTLSEDDRRLVDAAVAQELYG